MALGHFIWTDLSTYDMKAGRVDYSKFFGWRFEGDADYDFAFAKGNEVAALFPMLPRLSKMNMPSFWMSYVHVGDVEASVAKARQHDGVIIEVEPQDFSDEARIALVRDPSGAGFTLYEGPDITPKYHGSGTVESRFHHVPDIALIQDFYADLFGWRFEKRGERPWPVFDIHHPDGTIVAQAEEVPEAIRGKFRYWMPCFAVDSHEDTVNLVRSTGGKHLSDLPGNRVMLADRQGAHFMIRSAGGGSEGLDRPEAPQGQITPTGSAWKSVLGLVCVWLAVFLDIQMFWGVLFLIWTWPALKSGRSDFVEPIYRAERPAIYWAIVGTWVVLSLWLIASTLFSFDGG